MGGWVKKNQKHVNVIYEWSLRQKSPIPPPSPLCHQFLIQSLDKFMYIKKKRKMKYLSMLQFLSIYNFSVIAWHEKKWKNMKNRLRCKLEVNWTGIPWHHFKTICEPNTKLIFELYLINDDGGRNRQQNAIRQSKNRFGKVVFFISVRFWNLRITVNRLE